jgi:hypothetical protein
LARAWAFLLRRRSERLPQGIGPLTQDKIFYQLTLADGAREVGLIQGTLGHLQCAEFAENAVLEFAASEEVLRTNITDDEISKRKVSEGESAMKQTRRDLSATETADRKWRGLYCVSGILLILVAALSFVVAYGARILYASGYPSDPASYLKLVSQHQLLASITWSLWIVIDFLGIAPTVALYIVLHRHNRSLALFGSLLAMFYAIYDFSVTELNSLTLVSLSHGYASASTDALRASFVAAATYGYYALPFQTVLSFAIGPMGYLLWCVPMAKSIFGRWTAIGGAVVSVIGLLGAAAPVVPSSYILGLFQFICVRALALWAMVVGVQLYRYGRRLPANVDNTAGIS